MRELRENMKHIIRTSDMRERYTSTSTLLGTAQTNMAEQKNGERIRLKLESPNPDGRTAGFVTITSWIFDLKIPASTDSTPVHRPTHGKKQMYCSRQSLTNSLIFWFKHLIESNIKKFIKKISYFIVNW